MSCQVLDWNIIKDSSVLFSLLQGFESFLSRQNKQVDVIIINITFYWCPVLYF